LLLLLLQACQEEVAVQSLGVLQSQQRGLWWGLHCGPLAHPQVHGLGLRAWHVCKKLGAAWGYRERAVRWKAGLQELAHSLISLIRLTQQQQNTLKGPSPRVILPKVLQAGPINSIIPVKKGGHEIVQIYSIACDLN
jgi:hypothetical protein